MSIDTIATNKSTTITTYFLQNEVSTTAKPCYIFHQGKYIEVDPNQLWFWSEDWQDGENKVNIHIENGDIETFDNIEDFINTL